MESYHYVKCVCNQKYGLIIKIIIVIIMIMIIIMIIIIILMIQKFITRAQSRIKHESEAWASHQVVTRSVLIVNEF